ncbi:MAG: aromatic-L-amino-acid decarboxylase [Planctomycetota bacterium]|jgi:aromatic-L-amino-acid decarboxylase
MFAYILAAGINSNAGFGDQCVTRVEGQVVRWMREALGYDERASGTLVSGYTVANLAGVLLARNARAGWDVRSKGLRAGSQDLAVYGSSETHSSIKRAMEVSSRTSRLSSHRSRRRASHSH